MEFDLLFFESSRDHRAVQSRVDAGVGGQLYDEAVSCLEGDLERYCRSRCQQAKILKLT